MHPLLLVLDSAALEVAPGVVARGQGQLDLLSPWGPHLRFEGQHEGDLFDAMTATAAADAGAPGELRPLPSRTFRARTGDFQVEASKVLDFHGETFSEGRPTTVTGEYRPVDCRVVGPAGAAPTDGVVVDVHHLGRGCEDLAFPLDHGLPVPGGAGAVIRWGDHRFILRHPDRNIVKHARWAKSGTFTYHGPARPGTPAFWRVVWPFSLVLGSVLGSPVAPVGWVTWSTDRRTWFESTWRTPGKPHLTSAIFRPVGGHPLAGAHRDVVAWVEAGLAAWDRMEPRLGLEVALIYLENAHGQAEPEIRCRDLVNAIERLIVGYLRYNGGKANSKIKQSVIAVQKLLGRDVFTGGQDGEIADLARFRNRLAHDGGLKDERTFGLEDQQALHYAEGWLATCCYRLLAALLGVDPPLADMAVPGEVRRRPSEGGFARSPFVPEPT